MRQRLHLVSLPHTRTTKDYLTCAYTQKVVKGAKMFMEAGHEVFLYSSDENEAPCTEHIPLVTQADREAWGFGEVFDTAVTPFLWDANQIYWKTMNERAINAIRERSEERDMLLVLGGWCQHPVSVGLRPMMTLEWGCGYEGIFSNFVAFESYAWMHHVYGIRAEQDKGGNWRNGRYYDQVIPNFFDIDDFAPANGERGDYLLFMGRVIERKGPHVAAMIAERLGMPLVVAGPGVIDHGPTYMVSAENNFRIENKAGIRYVGTAGVEERKELMANARCLLVPTIYLEPFGGVAVEAMLSGTPVVASDWGAFVETVEPGNTGYRFRTLQQGADAVKQAMELDPKRIRKRAVQRYSLPSVARQFDRWFDQLQGLWGLGWSA
jgi:glycosyltransferase involved in cell wall biosynthesis